MEVKEIAKFLKESVDWLLEQDMGCCTLKLDDRLAICVGWLPGYGEEKRDDVIQSPSEPDFAINAGVKVWTSDDMRTDYEFINMPYYDNGDVLQSDVSIEPEENYEKLAEWLLHEYDELKELKMEEDGRIIEEPKGEEVEESLEENATEEAYEIIGKAYVEYWDDVLSVKETEKGLILTDKDNGHTDLYDSWKDICEYEEIIDGDKVYNLRFSEDEAKKVNGLLKSLNKDLLGESLKEEKELIKTVNSCVDAADLADMLEAQGIKYEFADTGIFVDKKDFARAEDILRDMESSCDESCKVKKELKETWAGEDVVNDIIDRATSKLDEGEDIDDAVFNAIDEGLIYTKDIYSLVEHYGSIDSSTMIESFYDDLYSDVYSAVKDYIPEEEEEDPYEGDDEVEGEII